MKINGWIDLALLPLPKGAGWGLVELVVWVWNASALLVTTLLLMEVLIRFFRREVAVDLIAFLAIAVQGALSAFPYRLKWQNPDVVVTGLLSQGNEEG
jgi:hypothetical protein